MVNGNLEKRYTDKQKEEFKKRLKKIIGTKINTTMIYPLSQFELAFGGLWGHGKAEAELTEDEKINRQVWNQVRNSVLNMGNQQKRNAFAEINNHDIVWNRFSIEFIVNKDN